MNNLISLYMCNYFLKKKIGLKVTNIYRILDIYSQVQKQLVEITNNFSLSKHCQGAA